MSEIQPVDDRRQRALEAYSDAIVEMYNDLDLGTNSRLETAIEVATQVKITDDIWQSVGLPEVAARAVCGAAFRAAGFEVVE